MSQCLSCAGPCTGAQRFCGGTCLDNYFAAVKAANPLAEFCRKSGINLKRKSGLLLAFCPFHEERSESFTVYDDGHFHCFGCGAHGDVIDVHKWLTGISRLEAAEALSRDLPLVVIRTSLPKTLQPYELSKADQARMDGASSRLAYDPMLTSRLVAKRPEWTVVAIQTVAMEGDLGYESNCIFNGFAGAATLFAYTNGIKARWKGKVIRWLCGSPCGQCWRQSLLSSQQLIYLTEGETDALTLLSFAVEEPERSLVLALAGATTLPNPEPFDGRDIVIVPDPDQAGQQAERKLRDLLDPIARSITTILVQEVLNA